MIEKDLTHLVPPRRSAKDSVVFNNDPTPEDVAAAVKEEKIVVVRIDGSVSIGEISETVKRLKAIKSSYVFLYTTLLSQEEFEKELLEQMDAEPMWYAPAGYNRGKLSDG